LTTPLIYDIIKIGRNDIRGGLNMKTLRITSATLAILAAALLTCGCSENKTDYDYDLIGGEVQNTDSNYDVDIRKDAESTPTDNTTSKSEVDASAPAAPTTSTTPTTSTESKPAAPTQPNNTSNPDTTSKEETGSTEVPKKENTSSETSSVESKDEQTSEPATPSTTSTPAKTEPNEPKYDENGFPANPVVNQTFVDSTGTSYVYDTLFGWIRGNNGNVDLQEFPTFEVEGGDEIILH